MRRLDLRTWLGLALIAGVGALAVLAPWIAPNDPQEVDLLATLLPPAWAAEGIAQYPLGTDSLGRCLLSRLIWGARVAIKVATLASLGALALGAPLAILAGYYGGWVDWFVSRAVDLWMSFPPVVLSLILLIGFGTGLGSVIWAIILVDWTRFARVVRAEVLVIAARDYVPAARLLGFGHLRTMLREVLPGVAPLLATLLALEMGIAVVVEAILSFTGLSLAADTPAWGVMIADARPYINQAPWALLAPTLAILVTVIGFNFIGDGLRRQLDPRLFRRV